MNPLTTTQVAELLGVSRHVVYRVAKNYALGGELRFRQQRHRLTPEEVALIAAVLRLEDRLPPELQLPRAMGADGTSEADVG